MKDFPARLREMLSQSRQVPSPPVQSSDSPRIADEQNRSGQNNPDRGLADEQNRSGQGKPAQGHSARRINRLAAETGAQTYLEIGVSRAVTFRSVQIARKVGVDPNFRCDVSLLREMGSELHQITSDRYFASYSGSPVFDVIFLDGLHQFQQTFRDFCNSLCCAHPKTVWIIDDVFPNDVYSSLPNQHDNRRFRKLSGINSKAWHGDIFKMVFAIHDFFPMLRYVTIFGSGNPQTIVWRATRDDFSPLFNSLETIERLTYFDILDRKEMFNPRTEDEAFSEIFPVH